MRPHHKLIAAGCLCVAIGLVMAFAIEPAAGLWLFAFALICFVNAWLIRS